MSSFLSCSRFDLFEVFGKLRLIRKIIDATAQPTDMTVVAHDQMLSDPAQGNAAAFFDQVANQTLAPIVLSKFAQITLLELPLLQSGTE